MNYDFFQVSAGDVFEDYTGLAVEVGDIDVYNQIHWDALEGQEQEEDGATSGEMSYEEFITRFHRIGHKPHKVA